jgi:hypothetical protein
MPCSRYVSLSPAPLNQVVVLAQQHRQHLNAGHSNRKLPHTSLGHYTMPIYRFTCLTHHHTFILHCRW